MNEPLSSNNLVRIASASGEFIESSYACTYVTWASVYIGRSQIVEDLKMVYVCDWTLDAQSGRPTWNVSANLNNRRGGVAVIYSAHDRTLKFTAGNEVTSVPIEKCLTALEKPVDIGLNHDRADAEAIAAMLQKSLDEAYARMSPSEPSPSEIWEALYPVLDMPWIRVGSFHGSSGLIIYKTAVDTYHYDMLASPRWQKELVRYFETSKLLDIETEACMHGGSRGRTLK